MEDGWMKDIWMVDGGMMGLMKEDVWMTVIDEWMDKQMDGWMNSWIDGRLRYGWMTGEDWMDSWIDDDNMKNEWTDGQMGRSMGRWRNGDASMMGGWMEG